MLSDELGTETANRNANKEFLEKEPPDSKPLRHCAFSREIDISANQDRKLTVCATAERRRLLRMAGAELEGAVGLPDRNIGKSGRFQTSAKRVRFNYYHRIKQVHQLKCTAPDAVRSGEKCAGPEHSEYFADQAVLKDGRRNVVEHGE